MVHTVSVSLHFRFGTRCRLIIRKETLVVNSSNRTLRLGSLCKPTYRTHLWELLFTWHFTNARSDRLTDWYAAYLIPFQYLSCTAATSRDMYFHNFPKDHRPTSLHPSLTQYFPEMTVSTAETGLSNDVQSRRHRPSSSMATKHNKAQLCRSDARGADCVVQSQQSCKHT